MLTDHALRNPGMEESCLRFTHLLIKLLSEGSLSSERNPWGAKKSFWEWTAHSTVGSSWRPPKRYRQMLCFKKWSCFIPGCLLLLLPLLSPPSPPPSSLSSSPISPLPPPPLLPFLVHLGTIIFSPFTIQPLFPQAIAQAVRWLFLRWSR